MTKESEYKEVLDIAIKHNKLQDFHIILEDYFIELEKYHPQTYTNLMRELHKLGAKINIDDKNELSKYIKHIHHKDIPQLWTVDQTTKVAEDIGIDFNKWKFNTYTFNYVMNMMRADYYSEFKKMFVTSPLMKQTVLDSPNFYAHMAKAWLDDEDAPVDKAIKYIRIVTNECNKEE